MWAFNTAIFRAQCALALYRSPVGRKTDLDDTLFHLRRALGQANAMGDKARVALCLRQLSRVRALAPCKAPVHRWMSLPGPARELVRQSRNAELQGVA